MAIINILFQGHKLLLIFVIHLQVFAFLCYIMTSYLIKKIHPKMKPSDCIKVKIKTKNSKHLLYIIYICLYIYIMLEYYALHINIDFIYIYMHIHTVYFFCHNTGYFKYF